jgi:hypothetical protein
LVALEFNGGYSTESLVYVSNSSALVGLGVGSDVPTPPCGTYETAVGREFDCETFVECQPCPVSSAAMAGDPPACD